MLFEKIEKYLLPLLNDENSEIKRMTMNILSRITSNQEGVIHQRFRQLLDSALT